MVLTKNLNEAKKTIKSFYIETQELIKEFIRVIGSNPDTQIEDFTSP